MKNIVIANWKMNTTLRVGTKLFNLLRQRLGRQAEVEVVICPPFTHLAKFDLKRSNLKLGAQNVASIDHGALTGEVSAEMLKDLKVEFVLLGHSERRQFLNEDEIGIINKFKLCEKYDLTRVLCIGENLKERKNGQTLNVIFSQLREVLKEVSGDKTRLRSFLVAYEPIWSIGTGDVPTAEEIRNIANMVREFLRDKEYSARWPEGVRFLYGGSVTSKTAQNFIRQENIDGFLVGGASLDLSEFIQIVKACQQSYVS